MKLNEVFSHLGASDPRWALPLDHLTQARTTPRIVAVSLALLGEVTGAATLAELARADVDALLPAKLSHWERRAFFRGLSDAVRRVPAAAVPVPRPKAPTEAAPATSTEPSVVPAGGPALDAWAERFGISDVLASVIQFGGYRGRFVAIATLADLVRHPDLDRQLGRPRSELRAFAERRLQAAAIANAPRIEARAAFLARRRLPEDPWVLERVRALTKVAGTPLAPHALEATPAGLLYPAAHVEFRPHPPSLAVSLRGAGPSHDVDLLKATVTTAGAYWDDAPARMDSNRVTLECAIDALCDPDGQPLRDAVTWARTPAWSHMLDGFGAALAKRSSVRVDHATERIAFRMPHDGGAPEILVQRARAGGTFTPGRQEDPYAARSRAHLSALEREIIDLLEAIQGNYGGRDGSTLRLRILELLGEHPRVQVEPYKLPFATVKARPTLRLARRAPSRETATGGPSPETLAFHADIVVGTRTLSAADALAATREGRIFQVLDPGRQTLFFGQLDAVSLSLVEALATYPQDLPGEGISALLRALQSFPEMSLALELPEEVRGEPVAPDDRLVVQLTIGPDASLSIAVRVRPLASAPIALPGAPPRHVYGTNADGARVFATRDLDGEEARAERLLAELPLAESVRKGPFD